MRISRTVTLLGTEKIFALSQGWAGYERARKSWHKAFWKWVDSETPEDVREKVQSLRINWPKDVKLSCFGAPPLIAQGLRGSEGEKRELLVEYSRQEYLVERATFFVGIHGPEAKDPEFYSEHLDFLQRAKALRDRACFESLAEQKQRKVPKGEGDRRLKFQLLHAWIPACLWAFTTEGVAHYLKDRWPRSGSIPYDNRTVSDARRSLQLFRVAKPLYWGLSRTAPLTLVAL